MPRTKIDKTAPPAEAELREQTWRVLLLDEPAGAGEPRWHEVGELTGSGEYGYRPDADELGKVHGAGSFLIVEADTGSTFLSAYSVVVGMEPHYFDTEQRRRHEVFLAERELERKAEELADNV